MDEGLALVLHLVMSSSTPKLLSILNVTWKMIKHPLHFISWLREAGLQELWVNVTFQEIVYGHVDDSEKLGSIKSIPSFFPIKM